MVPFVCDVFGAIRSDARQIVSILINKRLNLTPTERPAEVGNQYWSAVTAAAVGKAAVTLAKLAAVDSVGLCPMGVLSLQTARTENAVLHRLTAGPAAPPLQLFVRGIDGSTISLQLPASTGLMAPQTAIKQGRRIPAREQRLTFAGKLLRGEGPLLACGNSEGSKITLSLGLLGGAQTGTGSHGEEGGMGKCTTSQPSLPSSHGRIPPQAS